MVYKGRDGLPALRHFGDVATDWPNDAPELFRLLVAEMKNGTRFAMPDSPIAPMHEWALKYSCETPDILARLLMESKLQRWSMPSQMRDWVQVNTIMYQLMMEQVVDRPIIRFP